jgi:hydrogenase maturation protease
MTASLVEKIADAVLYEGYILYPYRPSAVKNQQRWNFGALCPPSYSRAQGETEHWTMQTECLVRTTSDTSLEVKVRFLHLLSRTVGQSVADCQLPQAACAQQTLTASGSSLHFHSVPALAVNGNLLQTWQEAVEREVTLPAIKWPQAEALASRVTFNFPGSETSEPLTEASSGELLGIVVRRQYQLEGAIEVSAAPVCDDVFRIKVQILNLTPLTDATRQSRDEALMRSCVSTHTILRIAGGEFVSLLDPPANLREAAAGCSNIGTYPVLAGAEGSNDCMLSSPIILYDYPQIAPESAGNLYDGTEIDEILTLRIMTLTDAEKREMRGADERARRILERTEMLPAEQFMKMHGAMKSVKR